MKLLLKFMGLLLATAFFTVVFFCLNTGADHANNNSASCCLPASAHARTLRADFSEHLQHWQQALISTHPPLSSNNLFGILSMLLAAMAAGSVFFQCKNFELFTNTSLCKARNSLANFFDPMRQALSSGRLNPRLYNLSFLVPWR